MTSPDTVDESAAFAVVVLAVVVVGLTELVVVEAVVGLVVAEVVSCNLSSLGGSVTFTTRLSGRKVFSSSLRAALIFQRWSEVFNLQIWTIVKCEKTTRFGTERGSIRKVSATWRFKYKKVKNKKLIKL